MAEKKPDKKTEADLFSSDTPTVLATLERISFEGTTSQLPLLFELLNSRPEEPVTEKILKILGSLKVRDAAPVLADALQDPRYKSIRKSLATACWQNGLDYSDFLPVFVDLVVREAWETAFEAFTVIENMEHFPEKEMLEQTTDTIHSALKDAGSQKKYFLHEILSMIRSS